MYNWGLKIYQLKNFITCHIKQWPYYWLAELPNTLLNCSRHDMVTASLIPGSTVSFSKTVALLGVHPELQSLWTFFKWTVNAWQFACAVLPISSSCLFTYVPTTSMLSCHYYISYYMSSTIYHHPIRTRCYVTAFVMYAAFNSATYIHTYVRTWLVIKPVVCQFYFHYFTYTVGY